MRQIMLVEIDLYAPSVPEEKFSSRPWLHSRKLDRRSGVMFSANLIEPGTSTSPLAAETWEWSGVG